MTWWRWPANTRPRFPRSPATSGSEDATLHNWLRKADVDDGVQPGVTTAEAEELRAQKQRNRLLEQENEILRRAAAFFARELPPKWFFYGCCQAMMVSNCLKTDLGLTPFCGHRVMRLLPLGSSTGARRLPG